MLLFVSTIGDLAGRRQQPIRGGQGYLLGRPSPHIAQMPTSLPIELAMKQRYDRSGPAQMRRALEDAS
jgi:hypothetical protein